MRNDGCYTHSVDDTVFGEGIVDEAEDKQQQSLHVEVGVDADVVLRVGCEVCTTQQMVDMAQQPQQDPQHAEIDVLGKIEET